MTVRDAVTTKLSAEIHFRKRHFSERSLASEKMRCVKAVFHFAPAALLTLAQLLDGLRQGMDGIQLLTHHLQKTLSEAGHDIILLFFFPSRLDGCQGGTACFQVELHNRKL